MSLTHLLATCIRSILAPKMNLQSSCKFVYIWFCDFKKHAFKFNLWNSRVFFVSCCLHFYIHITQNNFEQVLSVNYFACKHFIVDYFRTNVESTMAWNNSLNLNERVLSNWIPSNIWSFDHLLLLSSKGN